MDSPKMIRGGGQVRTEASTCIFSFAEGSVVFGRAEKGQSPHI